VIPESHDAEALCLKPNSPLEVCYGLFRMLTTVEFEDQLALEIDEINYIVSDRGLSAEFSAIQLPKTKRLPKMSFGIGHVFAQRASEFVCHAAPPTLTLPHKGGGDRKALPHKGEGTRQLAVTLILDGITPPIFMMSSSCRRSVWTSCTVWGAATFVEMDEAFDPPDIRFFGAVGIMKEAEAVPNLVEEFHGPLRAGCICHGEYLGEIRANRL